MWYVFLPLNLQASERNNLVPQGLLPLEVDVLVKKDACFVKDGPSPQWRGEEITDIPYE